MSSRKPTILESWLGISEKKRSFLEISDDDEEDAEDGLYDAEDGETLVQDNSRNASPLRKSAKSTRFGTPGQPFLKRLEACKASSLPTPNTSGRDVEAVLEARRLQSQQARAISPTPVQLGSAIELGGASQSRSKKSDLSRTVIALIRADYRDLKESTEIMIRHEIEQEVGRHQAEAKQFERTISRFRNRMEVLQRENNFLVTGAAVDDVVDLSDSS